MYSPDMEGRFCGTLPMGTSEVAHAMKFHSYEMLSAKLLSPYLTTTHQWIWRRNKVHCAMLGLLTGVAKARLASWQNRWHLCPDAVSAGPLQACLHSPRPEEQVLTTFPYRGIIVICWSHQMQQKILQIAELASTQLLARV